MYRVIRASEDFEEMDRYDQENFAKRTSDPSVLAKLADNEDYRIRAGVASNENTSAEILARLAEDEDDFVREMVAYNENTLAEILENLADDWNWRVRLCVAGNINTPVNILQRLADEGGQVGQCAMETLNFVEPLLT